MFAFNTKVSYSRVDKSGQVPLYEIMNYLQDCTNFHSESLGVGIEYMNAVGKAWIIIAYKIKINKPIMLGQEICIGTAPTKFNGAYASRNFFIKDDKGEYLVQADSTWILMDVNNRRPLRITEEDSEMYHIEAEFEGLSASRRLKLSKDKKRLDEFKVKKTYIDNNGHMNNADYLRAAEEFLPEGYQCRELDIVYSKEALEGEKIIPFLHDETDGIGISFESQAGEVLSKIKLIK